MQIEIVVSERSERFLRLSLKLKQICDAKYEMQHCLARTQGKKKEMITNKLPLSIKTQRKSRLLTNSVPQNLKVNYQTFIEPGNED